MAIGIAFSLCMALALMGEALTHHYFARKA